MKIYFAAPCEGDKALWRILREKKKKILLSLYDILYRNKDKLWDKLINRKNF